MLKIKDSVDLKELKEKGYIMYKAEEIFNEDEILPETYMNTKDFDRLRKELEVYKRALDIAYQENEHTAELYSCFIKRVSDQARKELEDERKQCRYK